MYDFNGDGVLYALVIVKCNQLCSVLVVCGKGALITLGRTLKYKLFLIQYTVSPLLENKTMVGNTEKEIEVHEYC